MSNDTHNLPFVILISVVATLGGFLFGFDSGVINGTVDGLRIAFLAWGFEAWRWMFWVEMVPASIFLAALLFIPESPRFLVTRGRRDRAIEVLEKLLGSAAAAKEQEIYDSLASDHHAPRLRDLVDDRRGLKPLVWVGIALAVFQQLVGINVVFYYGTVLWQSAGFAESDALLINVLSGGVSIAACIATVLLIDRIGRKPILLFGSVSMAITLSTLVFVFGGAAVAGDGTLQLSSRMGIAALIAANAYVVFFNFSWGPVMWVMLSEMFPNQLRGSGLAVSGLAQWLANFLVTLTFPVLLATIGLGGAYGLYAMAAFVSIAFVWFMVHETKGVELEDMQA